MTRDIRDFLKDIYDSIHDIEEFTEDLNYEDFIEDRKTVNAVIRSLEIIGEAAKKIPEEIRQKYPSFPWKGMAGMRDKLIHEYHGVDLEIVWTVSKEEIPPVKSTIKNIISDQQGNRVN